MHSTVSPDTTTTHRRMRWRVVDILVASVLGVALGLVFWVWALASNPLGEPFKAILPGFQGLINGPWLMAGVLGALVVRKPGAAIYTELIAALVEAVLGSHWGATTLLSGLVQGLGAEIVFALGAYRLWGLPIVLLAGIGTGIAESVIDWIVWYPAQKLEFIAIYAASTTVSALLVAGLGSWLVVRGLARTGALDRFEAGRLTRRGVS